MLISDWSSDVCSSDLHKPFEDTVARQRIKARKLRLRRDDETREVERERRKAMLKSRATAASTPAGAPLPADTLGRARSVERGVGQERVSTCRSGGGLCHYNKRPHKPQTL